MKNTTEKLPPVMIERPELPQATRDALKAHIIREKVKKKQALEQTQEFERLRREREQKKKEQAFTLEETKSEIARLEHQLTSHKEAKHMLFQKLKKVIHQEQGMKENDKSSFPNQTYLQPPSRVSGMSIYQRSSAAYGIVSLAENMRSPPRSGPLKRPSDPFMGESPFGPPVTEDPYKRQRQLMHDQENGKKMMGGPVHDSLNRSSFNLREPNTEQNKLIQSREDHFRQSGRSTMGGPPSSNPITPSASPSTASTNVDLQSGPRKTPAASPLTAPHTPSTETIHSEVHDPDVNIQSETSSKSTGHSPVSVEGNPNRKSADGEKNSQSMAPIQSTLRPNPGQPWPVVPDNLGILPLRPIVSEIVRPTPSFALAPYHLQPRYGDGVPQYAGAFVRPFNDGLRFSHPTSEKMLPPTQNFIATGPNAGTAYVRLGEPGNPERLHQASTSFLPPNSNSSSGPSNPSSEPVTTAGPFYIPSHPDARIYSQHREHALVHYQQQAYAAAAMAHLPHHYRYDNTLMQGYPTYLGIPLMGAHPIQMLDQGLGRRTESYYEK